jgi:hypothetical protein
MSGWPGARLLSGSHREVCGSTPPASALLCRSSWSGRPPVERETTGSSPVRSAGPWWLLVANPDFHSGPRGFDSRPRCDASLVYRQDAWYSVRRLMTGSTPVRGTDALVAKLAYAPDSSPGAFGRVGSTPTESTHAGDHQLKLTVAHADARRWFDSSHQHRGAGTWVQDFLARRLRRVRLPVAPRRG